MKKRVNMSLDADVLVWLDGVGESIGCNRSEVVETLVEIADELELVGKLGEFYAESNGEQEYRSKRQLLKAARRAYLANNRGAWL